MNVVSTLALGVVTVVTTLGLVVVGRALGLDGPWSEDDSEESEEV